MNHFAVTKRELRLRALSAAVSGFVLCIVLVYAANQWVNDQPEVVDRVMEQACRLPTHDGEATIFIVVDESLRCYKYR